MSMYLERLRLDGKVAIVVGAGGGNMGTATSLALAEAGATVVGIDLTDARVGEVAAEVEAIGGTFYGVVADITRQAAAEEIVATAVREFGGVDCLTNIVGGTQVGTYYTVDGYPDEVWASALDLNLGYVFRMCRAVGAHMRSRGAGGAIVNWASVSSVAAAPFHGAYGAAKAAVESLTQTMAVELGPAGVRVNCIAPSGSVGPRNLATLATDPDARDPNEPLPTVVLPRVARPTDFAGVVLFLLSDLASWITGQVIVVDGGMTAQHPAGGPELWWGRGGPAR
jgi:NAD(P)-dependent dehydrogenase (short-subunit alcohol dehydrogenase family)